MAKTSLAELDPPAGLVEHLAKSTRESSVLPHPVVVNPGWWNPALRRHRLPGEVATITGSNGHPVVTRADVFSRAESAQTPDQWLTVLWHALAWGAGTSARNMERRLTSIAAGGRVVAEALAEAARLAKVDPGAAYRVLRPEDNLVRFLGPAFFSKFLYFAGAGDPGHPSLILDLRVARALHDNGWESLRAGGSWPAATYERYCDLLARWAKSDAVRDGATRSWPRTRSSSGSSTSPVAPSGLFDRRRADDQLALVVGVSSPQHRVGERVEDGGSARAADQVERLLAR